MWDLTRPVHLFFLLAILGLIFGPVIWSTFQRTFRPRTKSRDEDGPTGLPKEIAEPSFRPPWRRYLLIIILGNGLYYALYPHLPAAAQHRAFRIDLGIIVDVWFCLLVYGIFELARLVQKPDKS